MEEQPTHYYCLRCKDVELTRCDAADGYDFFKCPRCERWFARSPGTTTLHDRWGSPISHVLYYVIFAPDPPAEAESVAATVAAQRSREAVRTIIEEIRIELADPTQQVRDIHGQRQSEDALREYLRLLADCLERATADQ